MSSESIAARQNSEFDVTPQVQDLIVIRNPTERGFLQIFILIIPIIYLFRAVVELIYLPPFPSALFPPAPLDYLKIVGELALIVMLVFSNLLFSAIPGAISQLFAGKNLLPKVPENDPENTSSKLFVNHFDFWLIISFEYCLGVLLQWLC